MKIGEAARRLGVTPQAIRFYEQRRLLPDPPRDENAYRDYSAEDFERLRLLVGLRQLGLPLGRAASLATLCVEGRCDEMSHELREVIREQRDQIAARTRDLRHLDDRLRALDQSLAAGTKPEHAIARRTGGG